MNHKKGDQIMKCPKCGKKISDKAIAKHLASKGGSKSRRVLTPEQARGMVAVREAKRTAKGKTNER
jgi:predicted transcriptional regulator